MSTADVSQISYALRRAVEHHHVQEWARDEAQPEEPWLIVTTTDEEYGARSFRWTDEQVIAFLAGTYAAEHAARVRSTA